MGISKNLYALLMKRKKDKVITLSKLEILLETVDFYSSDTSRRGITSTGCMYNGENGTHCAFGRCMLPKYQKQGEKLKYNEASVIQFLSKTNKKIDDVLQEKYQGHELHFWNSIQIFHDSKENWDKSGVTFEGELAINRIIETYDLKTK